MKTILVEERIDCNEVTCGKCRHISFETLDVYYCNNSKLHKGIVKLDLHCFTNEPMRTQLCIASTKIEKDND
jgi:hypothetical protein